MLPETKEILDKLQVDTEKTLPRFLGKEDFYIKMLKRFTADGNYSKMKEHLEASDYGELFKDAHSLKGLSANLGLDYFYEAVEPLTESVRNEPYDSAEISAMAGEVGRRYEYTMDLISKIQE